MQKLIIHNSKHFSQANDTPPFTMSPLLDTIGRNSEQGLASIPEAIKHKENLEATTALLRHLQEYQLPQISCTFMGNKLKQSFEGWRESTSTSRYGTHLGLYKALVADDPTDTIPTVR
ncbi:hypothetical protein ACA910_010331 [Epithemia clementina (nom. ined.)]